MSLYKAKKAAQGGKKKEIYKSPVLNINVWIPTNLSSSLIYRPNLFVMNQIDQSTNIV